MLADVSPMQARSAAVPPLKTSGKMRLKTLAALDGRTVAARRAAALVAVFSAELGELTPAQQIAVQNAAALTAISEDAAMRRLSGDPGITLDDLVRATSAARRAVRDLGLDRKREPAPGETFAEIAARAQAEADKRRARELAEDEAEPSLATPVQAPSPDAILGDTGGGENAFDPATAPSGAAEDEDEKAAG
jgi:hypothetical protein